MTGVVNNVHAMIPESLEDAGSLVVLPTVGGFLFALLSVHFGFFRLRRGLACGRREGFSYEGEPVSVWNFNGATR